MNRGKRVFFAWVRPPKTTGPRIILMAPLLFIIFPPLTKT
jgi:hypothetical protein